MAWRSRWGNTRIHTEWSNRLATLLIDKTGMIQYEKRGTAFGDRPKLTDILAATDEQIVLGKYLFFDRRRSPSPPSAAKARPQNSATAASASSAPAATKCSPT